jgi:hypothetical protein
MHKSIKNRCRRSRSALRIETLERRELMAATIVDSADPRFSAPAIWATFPSPGYYGGSSRQTTGRTDDQPAAWALNGLTPGRYRISSTWFGHSNRPTNARYSILDGTTSRGSVTKNQELTPNDLQADGWFWEDIGTFDVASGSLTVSLSSIAELDQFIDADALRVERVGDLSTPNLAVLYADDGGPNFVATGGWWPNEEILPNSFQSDELTSAGGTGSDVASWTFPNLAAGTYLVYATWDPKPDRNTTAAPYTVFDGSEALGTTRLDQQRMPDDLTDEGVGWELIGSYDVTSGKLIVALSDAQANSYVVADGIRIAQIATLEANAATPGGGATIYVEAESAASSTFNNHGWYMAGSGIDYSNFSPGIKGTTNGNAIGHYTPGVSSASAEWHVTATSAGSYDWWIRLNPDSSDYTWSINGSTPRTFDMTRGTDRITLTWSWPDIRAIDWVYVGKVDLQAGVNVVRVNVADASGESHGLIDALAFSSEGWSPTGQFGPGALPILPGGTTADPGDDWFAFTAGPDAFSESSVIDMSGLLEETAGSHGALQQIDDDFMFADGTPVKFWGTNARPPATTAAMVQQAKMFAKYGINMVRLHAVEEVLGLPSYNAAAGRMEFDASRLDQIDRWFAALKAEGIYMTWSVFYPHVITGADGYPSQYYNELSDATVQGVTGKSISGVVGFMPQLQQAEWNYLKLLMDHVNPYTGLAYKNDAALAIVETRNEDSLFWYSPLNSLWNGSMPAHRAELMRQFGSWVKARYGTEAALTAAWGTWRRPDDNWATGVYDIMGAFHLGANGPLYEYAGQTRRAGDFIQFLAQTQRDGYESRAAQLRSIGYQGVTVGSAWWSGGAAGNAANLWADASQGAIDRHVYAADANSGGHTVASGWIDQYSHLGYPFNGILSMGLWQTEDKPFIATEWGMLQPVPYRAEAAPLMALYGLGLQGWDASYYFTASDSSSFRLGWPERSAYVMDTPLVMGQFPALSLAIQRGDFAEGDPVAQRRLTEDQIFSGTDQLFNGTNAIPTEWFAAGRVTTGVGTTETTKLTEPGSLWDRGNGVITSNTGQLVWDYTNRVIQARSDRTQGVIGFAGGHTYSLPDLTVTIDTEYVSLLFTSLDGLPIGQSRDILVTATARDTQLGATTNGDPGTWLYTIGADVLLLQPVQATVTLGGAAISAVRPLDVYGVPISSSVPVTDNTFRIDGRYKTTYYQITRAAAVPVTTRTSPSSDPSAPSDTNPAAVAIGQSVPQMTPWKAASSAGASSAADLGVLLPVALDSAFPQSSTGSMRRLASRRLA